MNRQVAPPKCIAPHLWQFTEDNETGPYVDAYLLEGDNSALVVDALQTDTGLYEAVRRITQKPLALFITHGHLDHAGASVAGFHASGVPIYMSHRDLDLLQGPDPSWFIDLQPGHIFDLGGFTLRVLPVNGHSAGSMAALDAQNQLLFSGDSIGSGHFWMQLPTCSPLHVYLRDLEALYAQTRLCPDLRIYPGHRNQSPVQLTGQYVADNLSLTRDLVSGALVGAAAQIPWHGGELRFSHVSRGQVLQFCYDPSRL